MAYQMAATAVTLNDLEGHSSVVGFFKCNASNIYAAFYTISTDSVLARFLCISRTSCLGSQFQLLFTYKTEMLSFTRYCSNIIHIRWKMFKLLHHKFIQQNM